jgi:hypothetical protein
MYLPASELQQYGGQLACPYCIQDMRETVRRGEREADEQAREKPRLEVIQYSEQCERCGRDLESRVYIWNGKKLCKYCLEDEQDKWKLVGGGPMATPYRISLGPEKRRKKLSFLERIISDFLRLFGIKPKDEIEFVVYGGNIQSQIQGAKPMSEKRRGEKLEKKPEAESIMKVEKRKKKKKQ